MTHASESASKQRPDLRVGIIAMQDFTMLALAGFTDTLRLAADEADRSRPIRCSWTVMSEVRQPVRASNGLLLHPQDGLIDPSGFDYLAVVGGTLHGGPRETPTLLRYLARAADLGVPLVGLCTGVFSIARAGLMAGRRACVSWLHHQDYVAEFPGLAAVSDRLFLDEGDRITCAGGVSVIHLASRLVDRHCGAGSAAKGLRIMLEEAERPGNAPQPAAAFPALGSATDPRLRRAILMIERRLDQPLPTSKVAMAVGLSQRQLSRLFIAELGQTPSQVVQQLRLTRARQLICATRKPLAEIALDCGYADGSHLARRFRSAFGVAPKAARIQAITGPAGAGIPARTVETRGPA